jgi:membrane protease YdiL (CAAX protease family)
LFLPRSEYAPDKTLVHQLARAYVFSPMEGGILTPAKVLVEDGTDLIALAVAMLAMGRIEKRSLGAYGLPLRGGLGRNFWRGTLWGLAAICALMLTIYAGHGYSLGGLALSPARIGVYAAVWAAITFVASLTEELAFRGYAQFTAADGIGFWPAAAWTSAAFGVSHLDNPGAVWPGAIAVLLFGMFPVFDVEADGNFMVRGGRACGIPLRRLPILGKRQRIPD